MLAAIIFLSIQTQNFWVEIFFPLLGILQSQHKKVVLFDFNYQYYYVLPIQFFRIYFQVGVLQRNKVELLQHNFFEYLQFKKSNLKIVTI